MSGRSCDEREWGPWSVWKTELVLTPYIREFLLAGSRSKCRTFIDCFAGAASNIERGTGRSVCSSFAMAFGAQSRNGQSFTHLVGCETADRAPMLRAVCAQNAHLGQVWELFEGDVNREIGLMLAWWRRQGTNGNRPFLGQTFAYVDPDKHTDLTWELVKQIGAAFKDRSRRVEQLILLPLGTMRRSLPVKPGSCEAADGQLLAVDRMFGSPQWRDLYRLQRSQRIAGDDGWHRYSDLYRWHLRELGYSHVTAIETVNTCNTLQYHLIHASDEPIGRKIFTAVCDHARTELPRLLQEERERARREGTDTLFPLDDIAVDGEPARFYDHEPDLRQIFAAHGDR